MGSKKSCNNLRYEYNFDTCYNPDEHEIISRNQTKQKVFFITIGDPYLNGYRSSILYDAEY